MNQKQARIAALEIIRAMIWAEIQNPTGYTSLDAGVYEEFSDTMDDQPKVHREMEAIADELLRKLERLNQVKE